MQTNRLILFSLVIIVAGMVLPSCYYDKGDLLYHTPAVTDCTTNPAKYSVDIAPLMATKCATAGCHDAATAAGSAVLENYTQVSSKISQINDRCIVDKTMPSGVPLTATEISILSCWISSGAPNN